VVRITLFETDNVNKKDRANVKRFVQTIQHEYIHILNQTRPLTKKHLLRLLQLVIHQLVCYTTVAREEGFITDYARSNINEDFAEMSTTMLVNSK
jgi:substrate import-associated zinc metallohydrolase lipoprotein